MDLVLAAPRPVCAGDPRRLASCRRHSPPSPRIDSRLRKCGSRGASAGSRRSRRLAQPRPLSSESAKFLRIALPGNSIRLALPLARLLALGLDSHGLRPLGFVCLVVLSRALPGPLVGARFCALSSGICRLIPTGLRLGILPSLRARPTRDTSPCLYLLRLLLAGPLLEGEPLRLGAPHRHQGRPASPVTGRAPGS